MTRPENSSSLPTLHTCSELKAPLSELQVGLGGSRAAARLPHSGPGVSGNAGLQSEAAFSSQAMLTRALQLPPAHSLVVAEAFLGVAFEDQGLGRGVC